MAIRLAREKLRREMELFYFTVHKLLDMVLEDHLIHQLFHKIMITTHLHNWWYQTMCTTRVPSFSQEKILVDLRSIHTHWSRRPRKRRRKLYHIIILSNAVSLIRQWRLFNSELSRLPRPNGNINHWLLANCYPAFSDDVFCDCHPTMHRQDDNVTLMSPSLGRTRIITIDGWYHLFSPFSLPLPDQYICSEFPLHRELCRRRTHSTQLKPHPDSLNTVRLFSHLIYLQIQSCMQRQLFLWLFFLPLQYAVQRFVLLLAKELQLFAASADLLALLSSVISHQPQGLQFPDHWPSDLWFVYSMAKQGVSFVFEALLTVSRSGFMACTFINTVTSLLQMVSAPVPTFSTHKAHLYCMDSRMMRYAIGVILVTLEPIRTVGLSTIELIALSPSQALLAVV